MYKEAESYFLDRLDYLKERFETGEIRSSQVYSELKKLDEEFEDFAEKFAVQSSELESICDEEIATPKRN